MSNGNLPVIRCRPPEIKFSLIITFIVLLLVLQASLLDSARRIRIVTRVFPKEIKRSP